MASDAKVKWDDFSNTATVVSLSRPVPCEICSSCGLYQSRLIWPLAVACVAPTIYLAPFAARLR